MPEIPMPKSDAEDIILVDKEINEMYDKSKHEVDTSRDEQIKQKVLQEQDTKLKGMGFVTSTDMKAITDSYEKRLSEMTAELNKLKQILTRAKAQGKATIEPEEKDPKAAMRDIYGGFVDL